MPKARSWLAGWSKATAMTAKAAGAEDERTWRVSFGQDSQSFKQLFRLNAEGCRERVGGRGDKERKTTHSYFGRFVGSEILRSNS